MNEKEYIQNHAGCASTDNGSLITDRLVHSSARRPRAPYRHRSHRRTGKVARLPAAIRREVCLMFTRYAEYQDIIAWLASQGYPNISQSNLSRWRKGGFQDWLLREQEKRVDFITVAFDVLTALIKQEKNAAASASIGSASVPARQGSTDHGPLTIDPSSADLSHQSNNPIIQLSNLRKPSR